ncbi:MAG: hypothetical protein O7A03_06430 [Alphaproteobacteria bacterium]|nr:hypothetical protein [Alphaproteobacteria bacterium]
MRALLSLAPVMALLAACATMPVYERDGAGPEEIAAAIDSCRGQARQLTNRDELITEDIRAARPPSLRPGAADFIDEIEDLGPRRRFEDIVDDCMRRQGFTSNRPEQTRLGRGLWEKIKGE